MARGKRAETVSDEPVEGPWELPEGWRWERLGALATTIGGGRLKLTKADYRPSGTRAFSASGQDGYVEAKEFSADAVILSSIGARCGKCFIAQGEWTSLANTQLIFLQEERVDLYFAWLFLNNENLWPKAGSAQPFIRPRDVRDLAFPLPRIEIQQSIATTVKSLFTEIDEGERALAEARAGVETYRKALLKAAVTGELTADWRAQNPAHETGEDLLRRLLADRRALVAKAPKARPDLDIAGDGEDELVELPNGWCWSSVGNLTIDSLIGLDRGAQFQNRVGVGTPYVKMNNVSTDGFVSIDNLVCVPADDQERKRFGLREGDILFNTRNSLELVGKSGLVGPLSQDVVFNNNLMRLRFVPELLPAFVIAQMCSPPFRKRLDFIKRATTSVAAVYGKDLFALPLAVPPKVEQDEIVRRLRACEADVKPFDGLDGGPLRQSILAAAFRGDLVT